jgi:molecular chaperone HscB
VSENYFAFFGLNPIFNIDLQALEANFRKIQSEVHPDRFVTGTTTEKLHSMQTATLANEAYSTLKSPALRATYLLGLKGIQANTETNTSMPADFLMRTMEWRETLEEARQAKDIQALEALHQEMQTEAKKLQAELVELFDKNNAPLAAQETTRKLIFIDKVCADIHNAIEQLD